MVTGHKGELQRPGWIIKGLKLGSCPLWRFPLVASMPVTPKDPRSATLLSNQTQNGSTTGLCTGCSSCLEGLPYPYQLSSPPGRWLAPATQLLGEAWA